MSLSGHRGGAMSTYLILPRKVKAVLAGKALSRKVLFELDLKGLARLNQAEEGKKEKKNSTRKSMEAGKHVSHWGTGRMWHC